MTQSKKIAILGASGYTGAELVRLISSHPFIDIVALGADRKAGMDMCISFKPKTLLCPRGFLDKFGLSKYCTIRKEGK